MSLVLVPPGQRAQWKNGKRYTNPYYLVRGRVDGRPVETSTGTRDPLAAQEYLGRYVAAIRDRRVPGPGEAVSYAQATRHYIAYKQYEDGIRPHPIAARLRRLAKALDPEGHKPCGDVVKADLVAAAMLLYPAAKNETRNRWAVKLGATVLHYAAENKWCGWLRTRKLAEAPIVTRVAPIETARALVAAIEAAMTEAPARRRAALYRNPTRDAAVTAAALRKLRRKRLLIVWLFRHGHRIGDLLRLDWQANEVDLSTRTYRILIGKRKGGTWRLKPMDPELFELLANEPEPRVGRLFPWHDRSGVYAWLRPLAQRCGVKFTPHMARHWLGSEMNAMGAGQRTIAAALDHADMASSARYQDADFDIQRAAGARLRRIRRAECR